MSVHPRAGRPAMASDLIDLLSLKDAYYKQKPSRSNPVCFGTSGHRGSSLSFSFNESHIAAICQALVEYRIAQNICGPIYIGIDTHALSECAFRTAVEVLVANKQMLVVQEGSGFTPTPVISHAILHHNAPAQNNQDLADGIVITPSHNPPQDGGFKYNPPHGGPAGSEVTDWIEARANYLLFEEADKIQRQSFDSAWSSDYLSEYDFVAPYVSDLINVVDLQAIASANINIGVDPLGGASVVYWAAIKAHYGLNMNLINDKVDSQFAFMTLDKDGKIRMDCSSTHAMASVLNQQENFDLILSNDPDADRHGIVTRDGGLMNPNHYLAVAIEYLCKHRASWSKSLKVGKTLVSSSMIDRVVEDCGRELKEVPVGFKWFVEGLAQGDIAFGGEESAGASFLRFNGDVWSTDKDGITLGLLAAEILAVTGKTPSQLYGELTKKFSAPKYERRDAPANHEQKRRLQNLSSADVKATSLAGEEIVEVLTRASGNGEAIGGLKIATKNGWFAARPSGTEDIYKIYAESFLGDEHLEWLQEEAQKLVSDVLGC